MALRVTLYGKPDCHLCHEVQAMLERLATEYALTLTYVDITQNREAWKRYHDVIPVVEVEGGSQLRGRISETALRQLLRQVALQETR